MASGAKSGERLYSSTGEEESALFDLGWTRVNPLTVEQVKAELCSPSPVISEALTKVSAFFLPVVRQDAGEGYMSMYWLGATPSACRKAAVKALALP